MKPVAIERSIDLDRLSTRNEVHCALASQGALGIDGDGGDFNGMDSDLSGRTCDLDEDIMWLAIASEMLTGMSN